MDQAEEVKSKVDLVEVISSYIPLKKMGRNMGGLCPFHGEKTPSFMVSPERQAWKCFGCAESGDVYTFLEKIEGWDFREALEELAKRVGVKLTSFAPTNASKAKEKLLVINELSAKFYSHILRNHKAGEEARKYLEGRGIKKEMWEKFRLGFAPESWEMLGGFLTKRGFLLADIAMSGLVIARAGNKTSYYDRFRNRIIFPINNSRGQVMGFSGRVLDANVREAKYVNTSETAIFQKGSLLFGLDLARETIRNKNEAVLVEGEFDAISSYQAGIQNVVASKGTALTEKQAALVSRFCENVVLCFDKDAAGDAAARRGIELLDSAGLGIKVVSFDKWKDPDEFAQKDPKGLMAAIAKAQNVYDFMIDSAVKRYDSKDALGQKKIGYEILPVLSKISDEIVRAHYIDRLASVLDLDVALIAGAVEKKVERVPYEIGGESRQSGKLKVELEDYFLALFLAKEEVLETILDSLEAGDFVGEKSRLLWEHIRDIMSSSKTRDTKKLLAKLPKDLDNFVDEIYLINIGPVFADREVWAQELVKVGTRIKKLALSRQLSEISQKLKAAEVEADGTLVLKLNREFNKLSRELKKETLID